MEWGITRLVLAGLVHGARRQLGVAAGIAVASAVLVGALAVGDSVRGTLGATARARTGQVDAILPGGDRFFRQVLADELSGALEGARAAPVLQLLGTAATPSGDRRVHDVRVHGVDAAFWSLAPERGEPPPPPAPRTAYVSEAFAAALGVRVGDPIVVRVERPSAIPRDLALAPDDNSAALRVEVARILQRSEFGEFALDAAPAPAASVFVELAWLQRQMEVEGQVNLALLALGQGSFAAAEAALEDRWQLSDASLDVVALAEGRRELTTRRIFFDAPVVEALERLEGVPLTGVFTYFVNGIACGERSVPYSMVTGIGPLHAKGESSSRSSDPLLAATEGLADGALRLNRWAEEQLAPAPGATLTLDYYVVDASRRLVTREHTFEYAGSVPDVAGEPLLGSARGRELMPAFPGLADADSCREWEPGTPVDLERIRDVDEQYWDEHRGTPKAYMNLAAARALWTSRFGALTGARFDPADEAAFLAALRRELRAADVGLTLRDVRAATARAGASSTDFGGLFIGLSLFLLIAALALATQLFVFGVEGRARELGLLRAVGVGGARVQRIVLAEAAAVAGLGALLGAPLGLFYTRLVLRGLDTVWAGAVASTRLVYHATPTSFLIGASAAFFSALAAAWLALRGLRRRSPLQLLTSERGVLAESDAPHQRRAWPWALAAVGLALVLVLTTDPRGGAAAAGRFFGAGAAALGAALVVVHGRLNLRESDARAPRDGFYAAALTNARRRRARSFATVSSLALGVFLVLAVGANRLGPVRDVHERASGTGGFTFYGRTSLPLLHDLATEEGRTFFGLEEADLNGVEFVRLRVRDGDDASCLNLARPGAPRLLGVDPEALARRGAFSFAATAAPTEAPWRLLDEPQPDGAVPAIGDITSLTWQLKLGVGDTLSYTDERGRPFTVRIVGALADTILQGDLVLSERQFEAHFPGQSGHRRLLIEAPPDRAPEVGAELSRALSDIGLALEGTGARLDRFHTVQNTYLAIFQALGALGLLVGTLGLALVVLRNIQERRGELALLSAIGFTRARRARFVFAEHAALLAAALAAGAFGALFAIVPAVALEGFAAVRHALVLGLLVLVTGTLATLAAALPSARRAAPALLREE